MTRSYAWIGERRAQVRAALANGPLRQAQIAQAIGVTQSAASKILDRMLADGDVILAKSKAVTGHGPWPMRYDLARPLQPCST